MLTLETEKASVEVHAEESGTLNIMVAEGETVAVGAVVGQIDAQAIAAPSKTKQHQAPPPAAKQVEPVEMAQAHPTGPQTSTATVSTSSPQVVEHKEDLRKLSPSQRHKALRGELSHKAVSSESVPVTADVAAQRTKAPIVSSAPALGVRATQNLREKVKMTPIRKTIARRLKEVQNTAAILTTFNEVDMTNVMSLRKSYQEEFVKRHGIKLGFMSFFIKACVQALRELPAVNAQIEGDHLVYQNFYNVGVAVSTDKGLMVPVIRDADALSLSELEQSLGHFAQKAREGKITPDDLSGGTFSITNGGVFGSLLSTPILNPPQSAILGMHAIQKRPIVALSGTVEVRPMMYLALSYDHRLIDGKEAVRFLVRVKQMVEDPQRLQLQV